MEIDFDRAALPLLRQLSRLFGDAVNLEIVDTWDNGIEAVVAHAPLSSPLASEASTISEVED